VVTVDRTEAERKALHTSHLADDRLTRLIEVGRSLVAELDLPTVLDRVLEVAREITGARYAALGILDEEKQELEQFLTVGIDEAERSRIGSLPRGHGVLGLLIRDPEPLRLDDVGAHPDSYGFPPGHPPMKTFLGVPILIRGEAWGNLYLTDKADGSFTEQDEEALLILADWAAIAIENARLYHGVERRRRELERAVRGLEAATEIARALAGETELERVLELVVKRGRALVEATAVVIFLMEGDELVVRATAGDIELAAEGSRVPITGSLSGNVVLTGRAERVADVRGLRGRPPLVKPDATSALVIPLVFRGSAHGVITAFDRRSDGPQFSAEDERLLTAFGVSAAAAVATAKTVAEDRLRLSIEASEQERKRWALELHDDTLQGLAGLGMTLGSALRASSHEDARRVVESAIAQIKEETTKLRALIAELRPAALDEIGLRAAVESLVERASSAHDFDVTADISLASDEDGVRLAPEIESTAYRIVQEGLTNAGKHAGASSVEIRISEGDGAVEVTVRDNGRGFEPSAPRTGFGLTGMRERVEMLGGKLAVESSAAGLGTLLRASIPVRPAG
jgi:signal transduction histidine kinase